MPNTTRQIERVPFHCPVMGREVAVSNELLVHLALDGTELTRTRLGITCSHWEQCPSVAVRIGDLVTSNWADCAYLRQHGEARHSRPDRPPGKAP